MTLNIWNNIYNKFGEITDVIKTFFLNNGNNPILWIGIVLGGLIVFEVIFKLLNKD